MYVSFQENGTYKVASKSPIGKGDLGTGTYVFDGTKLSVKINGETDKSTITFINDSQFINHGEVETTFVRVTEKEWNNYIKSL